MARPKKDTIQYFPHPVKNGTKMFIMEQKYGDKGYVAYYKLLELLGASEGHFLDFSNYKDRYFFAASIRSEDDLLEKIMLTLCEIGAIDLDLWINKKIVFCQDLVNSVSDLYNKRNRNVPLRPVTGIENSVSDSQNAQSIVKESIINNIKLKETNEQHEYEKILLVQSQEFIKKWNEWLIYRKEIKKPYKSYSSMRLQILDLKKFSEEISFQMIDQSIRQSWQGIFELKNNKNVGTSKNQPTITEFKPGGPGEL